MNRAKIALVTLAAAAAVPTAMAAPASAATSAATSVTTSSVCTVKPLTPNPAGRYHGVKRVNYRISVFCPGYKVRIEQRRYEQDVPPDRDDFLGATSFTTSGIRVLNNVRPLVDTEPGNEEVYQKVRYRVIVHGVPGPWSVWKKSAVLSIAN